MTTGFLENLKIMTNKIITEWVNNTAIKLLKENMPVDILYR
jgi:hypothetical protein